VQRRSQDDSQPAKSSTSPADLADVREHVASARIGLWTWDVQSNQVFYSCEWKRQLGIHGPISDSLDEWSSRVHPDDAPRLQAQMQAVFASDATESESRCRLRHEDGTYRHILAQSSIIRDEAGQPLRLVGSHIDVTDAETWARSLVTVSARLIEATAADLDPILNEVLATMGQMEGAERCYLFLYDLERGTMSNSNEWCAPDVEPAIHEGQGLPLNEFAWLNEQVSRGLVLNFHVEELPSEADSLRTLLEGQSIQSVLAIPILVGGQPFGFMGFDAVHAKRRFTRENEELLRIVATMAVSAVRRVRAERAELEEKARRIKALESLERAEQIAKIGSWSFDPEEGTAVWSSELFHIFGFSEDEGVPSYEEFRSRVLPESIGAWLEAHRAAVEEGRRFDLTFGIHSPDGSQRWIRAIGEPEPESGPAGHVLRGVAQDVTAQIQADREREQLQAQLLHAQKMESIGRLAGGVAHDFNNMLGVMQGNLELALDSLPSEHPAVGDLDEVRRAAQRSADLTRSLLAFARRGDTEPRRIDPAEAAQTTIAMLRRLVPESIDLRASVPMGIWPVHLDPAHFDQIVINLGINARDALEEEGMIRLELENVSLPDPSSPQCSTPGATPGDYVRISVRDDGRGMEPEVIARVFEPYFTTKAVGAGTGLGLATVYGLVQQAGGFIEVDSAPGRGSAFHVFLPRTRRGEVALDGERDRALSLSTGQGETVVVVEDEPALAALTHRMLTRLNYTVIPAMTPSEAITIINRSPDSVQVLLTDVVMPQMSGRRLAATLCARHPNLRVLFMSGYSSEVIGKEEGALLAKPFSSVELARALRETLDHPPPRAPDRPKLEIPS